MTRHKLGGRQATQILYNRLGLKERQFERCCLWMLKKSVIAFTPVMITAAEFLFSPSAKRRLPQWVLSLG
jgi:hypothetical protein